MKSPRLVPKDYDPRYFQFLRDDIGQMQPSVWFELQSFAAEPNKPITVKKAGMAGAIFISSNDPIDAYHVAPTKRNDEYTITIVGSKKTNVTFILVGKN
jgi:hypothetical protein